MFFFGGGPNPKRRVLTRIRLLEDDGELLVRASAVLKSQAGARKLVPWETRSPSGAYKPTLCPGHIVRENPGVEKNAGGVASCDVAGLGCLWFSFLFVNGGRDLPQYIKKRSIRA